GVYAGSCGCGGLLPHAPEAVVGVFDRRAQRLRSVGAWVRLLWLLLVPPLVVRPSAPSTTRRPPPIRAPARTDWWIPIAWGRRHTRAGASASPPRRRPASAPRFPPSSSRPPRTRP